MLKTWSRKTVLTHLFFFSLFLVVPTLAFVRPPGEPFFALTRVFVQDTVANAVLLGFFYLNYYVLIPRYFWEHKYVAYAVCVLLFLALALMLPRFAGRYFLDTHPGVPLGGPPDGGPPHRPTPPGLGIFVVDEFRRHLYLFFTAVFFSFLLRTREYLSQLREEKLNAELSSLKAQINPHFLFNTLNTIYALAVKKDEKAAEAIVHLSGLMRYVTRDANDYKIPLEKELEYITNYVELQKARLGDTARVRFDCSGAPGGKKITPLILITYIENAFKYGVNPDVAGCTVKIKLAVTGDGLTLYTFNKKVPRGAGADSTGIGLKNTAERLTHLYPGKHSVQVTDAGDAYSVTLTIHLT